MFVSPALLHDPQETVFVAWGSSVESALHPHGTLAPEVQRLLAPRFSVGKMCQ